MKTLSCFVCLMFVTLAIPARADRPAVLVDQPFDHVYWGIPVAGDPLLGNDYSAVNAAIPDVAIHHQAIDDFFVTKPTMIDRATFTFIVSPVVKAPSDYILLFYKEMNNADWPDHGAPIAPIYNSHSVTLVERVVIADLPLEVYEVAFEGIDLLLEPGQYWASPVSVNLDFGAAWWVTSGTGTPLNGDFAYWRNQIFDPPNWVPAHEQGIGLEWPTDLAMTIEGTVLAEPGIVAELLDVIAVQGTHEFGDEHDLEESDNDMVDVRSERGVTSFEPNVMEIIIGAASPIESTDATTIDLTIESVLYNWPGNEAKIRLRNWETDTFEQVAVYDIYSHEERVIIDDIDAANYIRDDDGRIEISIRHIATATFSGEGVLSRFDEVEVRVHER